MKETASDSWLARRVMRLTRWEKRFVNDPANAERVSRVAGTLLEQVTLPPDSEQPAEAALKVTPTGSVSVMVTPVAFEGPKLVMDSV